MKCFNVSSNGSLSKIILTDPSNQAIPSLNQSRLSSIRSIAVSIEKKPTRALKRRRTAKRSAKPTSTKRRIRWTKKEKELMAECLYHYRHEFLFMNQKKRRTRGFFIKVSNFMLSHGYYKHKNQCKSHIQKANKHYKQVIDLMIKQRQETDLIEPKIVKNVKREVVDIDEVLRKDNLDYPNMEDFSNEFNFN